MTKDQKSMFKQLKKNAHRAAFVEMLVAQQSVMGRYRHWDQVYSKKSLKNKAVLALLDGGKIA
jgi:hypothetical protein